jgi:hypothetical protein
MHGGDVYVRSGEGVNTFGMYLPVRATVGSSATEAFAEGER